ncbi:MAG: hypothetical protein II047_03075 [Bacteroidales bacterium]|nr:hypothetical protein [Bacteroidales bacterium]
MKQIKYIFALSAAVALLASCMQKAEPYVPGEPDQANSYRISFPEQTVTSYEVDPNDPAASTVTITATRKVTSGKITVPLVIEQVPFDKDFAFENTELVFEDGQETAQFKVTFTKAEVGKEYTCHIMVADPKYASLYSSEDTPFISFTFVKVAWETLATGTLDSWWAEGEIPGVTLQHCVTFPERYRFVDPYKDGWDLLFTTFGDEKTDKEGKAYFNCRVAPTETSTVYGPYGNVTIKDVGYWQGDDKYAELNTFYPDSKAVTLYIQWSVSLGSIGAGQEVFTPNN